MSIATPIASSGGGWRGITDVTFKRPHMLFGRSHVIDVRWQPVQPSLPVLDYARRQLADLGHDVLGPSGLSQRTKAQVVDFLRSISDERTTFPSIAPDDEGVAVLHWVTGDLSLQIDVDETGPIYLWAKPKGGQSMVLTEPGPRLSAVAAIMLTHMADVAAHAKPNWRAAYVHA